MVRDVQRKVADPAILRKELQMIVIADEIAVGFAREHLLENPFFAGFEDARRDDPERRRIFDFGFSGKRSHHRQGGEAGGATASDEID